jgi:restriction system protein
VDLIANKDGERRLVQCKHWRTWVVQERVVREMLGSMAHFQVSAGAIYTLKGWTKPAAEFARQHGIGLLDAAELTRRSLERLNASQLDELLKPREHHCPKCESPMILRTGDFTAFWGCSAFPRCRGKMNHAGAR